LKATRKMSKAKTPARSRQPPPEGPPLSQKRARQAPEIFTRSTRRRGSGTTAAQKEQVATFPSASFFFVPHLFLSFSSLAVPQRHTRSKSR
jgi:hypothetical protein